MMKNASMKKIASITAAAALSLTPMATLAEIAQSALVQGGSLNLRKTASLTSQVLGQFPTGTLVEITETGDEWHKVLVNGQSGYMMAKYLNTKEGSTQATVRTNTGIGLNLREEPRLSGTIITSFKPGTEVNVLQKGSIWSRVEVDGKEGFMASAYLNFGSQEAAKPDATGRIALVSNPRDTQVLNLRKEASLDAAVLGQYRNGVRVTILEEGKTWHKVQVEDGKLGFMMAKFLEITDEKAEMAPFTMKLFNINGGSIVNFRKGPGLDKTIIDKIPVGTEVTVIEHGTDWCKVEIDGVEGYISTWFLK